MPTTNRLKIEAALKQMGLHAVEDRDGITIFVEGRKPPLYLAIDLRGEAEVADIEAQMTEQGFSIEVFRACLEAL